MAPVTPTKEPTSITAGNTVVFEVSPADYPPSDGWTADYRIVLPDSQVSATVTDDDQGTFTVRFVASAFQTIVTQIEGRLVGRVTGTIDSVAHVADIYDAPITILPNVVNATGTASRSADEIELAAVNAAILALTTTNIQSYSIGGRSVQKNDVQKLYIRQAILEARIRGAKGYGPRKRQVAFNGV